MQRMEKKNKQIEIRPWKVPILESFPHWKRSNEGNALTFLNEKKIKILDHSESQIKVLSKRPILTIQTNSQNPF